jgi:hypothetical protein
MTFAGAWAFFGAAFLGAAFFATFFTALGAALALTFFFGAALATFFFTLRAFATDFFGFATGRFLDLLFFAMVRLLLAGRVTTRI